MSQGSERRGRRWASRWVGALFAATVVVSAPGMVEAQPEGAATKAAEKKVLEEALLLDAEVSKLIDERKYDVALPLAERVLAIREKARGSEHVSVVTSLHRLARVYALMGDYGRALPLLQRALAIEEKSLGTDHLELSTLLDSLAQVHYKIGEYGPALSLHQRALTIREKALGTDHPDVATSLNSLAQVHYEIGEYARVLPLLQRALTIFEKELGPDHPRVATSLTGIAAVHQVMGEYRRAVTLHRRALSILEKAFGPDHLEVAVALNNLAYAYRQVGEYIRAVSLHHRALGIFETVRGPEHPDVAVSLEHLVILAEERGDFASALSFAERAAKIREKHLALISAAGSESQVRAYLATIARDVDHDIWRAVRVRKPEAARLALTTLWRRKGRALDATTESMRLLRVRLGPEEQKLFDELLSVRSQRSTLSLRGPDQVSLDKYKELLAELETRDEELQIQISQRSAEFKANEQPISFEAVKAALPKGAALVEWSVYQPFPHRASTPEEAYSLARYGACVLRSKGEPQCIDLDEVGVIDNMVVHLYRALSHAIDENVQMYARDLDARLMEPVRKLLGDTRWVFLSPDSFLNLIPFAALVDEDGHYLVERYAFTYLTSGRDLLRVRTDNPAPREKPTIIAAPDFDATGTTSPGEEQTGTERGVRSIDLSGMLFSSLPGTAREARTLAKQLGDVRLLLGGEATESALKALHGPEILHIATHGFFLPDQNRRKEKSVHEDPLLRSGLALSGANPRMSGSNDGILTALEVTGEDLYGTKLVVLSACETGLGYVKNGDGVYGLRRALFVAGARTQVMSLWRVDDEATQSLMRAYYERLQRGEGRSEAMRQVQLAMLADPDRSRPYYWASFIVSGDWTTLDGKPAVPELGRVRPGPRGCGCSLEESQTNADAGWAVMLALGLGVLRRARRTTRLYKAAAASDRIPLS